MILRCETQGPVSHSGRPAGGERSRDPGAPAREQQFRAALRAASGRGGRRFEDKAEDAMPGAAISGQHPDVLRSNRDEGRARTAIAGHADPVSASGVALAFARNLAPAHAAISRTAEAIPSELAQRFAAALDAPLATLRPGAEAAFVVSLPNAGLPPMTARVERTSRGALAVTLTMPGIEISRQKQVARDLKSHLAQRGWRDCALRVETPAQRG